MNRSAPAVGYVGSAKDVYRKRIWNAVRHHARGRHVLLMPSIEGSEIEIALAKGMSPALLHVVDRNPAIVAHIKRRFPLVNTYGVELIDACERIAKAGIRLAFANFDLCSQISATGYAELIEISQIDCFSSDAAIAVTCLRGRETSQVMSVLDRTARDLKSISLFAPLIRMPVHERKMSAVDLARIVVIAWAFARLGLISDFAGIYTSSNKMQTMLWTIMGRSRRLQDSDVLGTTMKIRDGVQGDLRLGINAPLDSFMLELRASKGAAKA